jgi:co-chaperonin GroES (HSP10)
MGFFSPTSRLTTDSTTDSPPTSELLATQDNLIVEDIEEDDVTASGLHLPSLRSKAKTRTARVLHVGPGKLLPDFTHYPMSVEPGDLIAYDRLSGTVISWADKQYIVVSERHVLAILERDHDNSPAD